MTTTRPDGGGAPPGVDPDLFASVRGVSGPVLAERITSWIEQGVLAPGTRLPTIEEVATASGLGRSTVAGTWSLLVDRGLVQTRRRGGTIVVGPPSAPAWPRAGEPPVFAGWSSVDLASAHPTATGSPTSSRRSSAACASPTPTRCAARPSRRRCSTPSARTGPSTPPSGSR
ncbi:winged helix-turn-helix domain-containing protein [Cellulosimicrobium sp. CUA-896]|uniref:winged helix-turn-helix domain-containing protein n=1 Tax=Cellulosimicrobium sp. CUA-896 TaxID=1517881 RepID=UPI00095E47C2|nr:winged helix-turn-helix domain-containing protein [Cellulosimicrobium sp. CUA-896]OLT53293.1 hypothetical protein BJF88_12050 [Cellulosimicrobium sp. CUA-896]